MIILYRHKNDIFLLVGLCLHVGSTSLQEIDHFDVAVQAGIMQSCHTFVVLYIDPCFELVFEGRVISVMFEILFSKGLKMKHVDLEFRQLIFVGCEMEQSGTIFLLHQGKVQLRSIFKISSEIVVALKVHDGVYGTAISHSWFLLHLFILTIYQTNRILPTHTDDHNYSLL